MTASPRVVLAGWRRPALAAARSLGLEPVVWAERAPGREAPLLPWGEPAAAAAALGTGPPPVAVVAVTEAAVAPAAALRATLGLPGLSLDAAERCTDKLRMKAAVRAAGLACARYASAADGLDRAALVRRLGLPIYLKLRRSSGGRGRRRLERADEVPEGVPEEMLAESRVEGEEMSLEALVVAGRRIFTNLTEYLDPGWANLIPRPTPARDVTAILALADRAIAALGVERGLVHLELFLAPEGPVFGELAARPPGGHLLRLIELVWGFDPWAAWLGVEIGRPPAELPDTPRGFAAAAVLHPGPGRVVAIDGVDGARRLPGVVDVELRVRPGGVLGPRLGTGQEAGHVVVAGAGRDAVVAALDIARRAIRFELEPLGPDR